MKKNLVLLIMLSLFMALTGCGKKADPQLETLDSKKMMGTTLYQTYTTPNGVKIWSGSPEDKWNEYITDAIDAAGITNEMSDYDKCVAINNYICSVVSYQSSTDTNMTQYEPGKSITTDYCLVLGEANCEGYADAYQSMCLACGIECYQSTGFMYDQNHRWNKVIIDDTEYWVDTTWNDEYDNAYLMSPTLWENHELVF